MIEYTVLARELRFFSTGIYIFFFYFQNPITEISRLAEFLNINLKDEDIAEIADKCSFKKLKLANDTIKDHSILDIGEKSIGEKIKEFMYRKGKAALILK